MCVCVCVLAAVVIVCLGMRRNCHIDNGGDGAVDTIHKCASDQEDLFFILRVNQYQHRPTCGCRCNIDRIQVLFQRDCGAVDQCPCIVCGSALVFLTREARPSSLVTGGAAGTQA